MGSENNSAQSVESKNKFLVKLESYRVQLIKNSKDAEIYLQQGILLHMLNRHQEARQSLEKSI